MEIKPFIDKCVRVWKLLKKPSKNEFVTISKISALGILVIGLLGFVISIIINLFI
ncbi:protein translocase SEC61 complex subunit gamma [Candidatus Pacearchaeota archaeon]|nr:protein translocase SEC61 complex subunit gamma [Candidatus Pacearchaeota archaeon]